MGNFYDIPLSFLKDNTYVQIKAINKINFLSKLETIPHRENSKNYHFTNICKEN